MKYLTKSELYEDKNDPLKIWIDPMRVIYVEEVIYKGDVCSVIHLDGKNHCITVAEDLPDVVEHLTGESAEGDELANEDVVDAVITSMFEDNEVDESAESEVPTEEEAFRYFSRVNYPVVSEQVVKKTGVHKPLNKQV